MKNNTKLKLVSLFSGIGAFEKSLTRQNISYELLAFSEKDKWAVTSYCAIHGVDEKKNLGDITKVKVEDIPDCDIITHGSPCQDFSVAGNGKGGDAGTNTRSSLMWYTVNIVNHKLPKYVIWENVKGVLFKKHKHNFDKYLEEMSQLGYNNYYQVLNAKNYGIPQNRERIFVVSIRKDIDNNDFNFPEPFDNGLRLKHMLEDYVDEKYYINEERCEKLLKELKEKEISNSVRVGGRGSTDKHQWDLVCIGNVNPSGRGINGNVYVGDMSPTLTTNKGEGIKVAIPNTDKKPKIIQVNNPKHFSERVYSKEGISPTISAGNKGGGKEPCKILEENKDTNKMLVIGNTVPSKHTAGRIFDTEGISPTVMYRNSKVIQILEDEDKKNIKEVRACLSPDRKDKRQNGRRFKEDGEPMFTLTASDRHGVIIKETPYILRAERTEYGKAIRKQYESGNVKEKISNMRTLQPRKDGLSNTITTVQKDNLVIEQNKCKQVFTIPKEILNDNERQRRVYSSEGISPTILARNDNAKILQVGMLDMKGSEQIRRVYDPRGIAPTLDTCGGGHREPKIICKKDNNDLMFIGGITEKDWAKDGKNLSRNFPQGERVYDSNGIACSQTAQGGGTGSYTGLYLEREKKPEIVVDKSIKPSVAKNFEREKDEILKSNKEIYQCKCNGGWQDNKVGLKVSPTIRAGNSHTTALDSNYKIRKLTPLECWRLMGFDDEDYWKARKALEEKYYNGKDRSNSQMYKQAGNSIVVNVLECIFDSLLH